MLTSRCNHSCKHCAYSCSKKGIDITIETFKKACKLAEDRGDNIFLGGGEPTLHPNFSEILGIALMYNCYDDSSVGIITNGSNTEISIKLARMAKAGVIYAGLSQDIYHDEIDESVVKAFQKNKGQEYPYHNEINDENDKRDIRKIGYSVIKAGRAKKLNNVEFSDHCICPELFVDPNGNIFWCGCKTKSLGTVDNPEIPDDYNSDCYKEYLKELKKEKKYSCIL